MDKVYDVIVLGAGPAGLTAGLYAGRARLSTLIIEKGLDGGQIAMTSEIENYPGQIVDEEESGASLIARMSKQAEKFGCERVTDEVTEVDLAGDIKTVTTAYSGAFQAKAVIIATGAHARPIGCTNEADFVGRGISFCATCDGAFFNGKEVYVVGGGDAAVEEAMFLTQFARKVTIVHRRDELRAAKSIQEKAFANDKINILWDTVVDEVGGDEGVLSRIVLRNVKTDEVTTVEADPNDGMLGLFGFTGFVPSTGLFEGKVDMDKGYILTDDALATSTPGVFAAGDLRIKVLRQVITAAADGAIAATSALKYLENLE